MRTMTSLPASAALGLAAAAALACSSPSAEEAFREISLDEVERSLGQSGFYVFDANTPEIFAQHHLPGARQVKGKDVAGALPAEKDAKLVFYCTSPS
jgi:rhodanese-related sulfurtransferase